MGIMFLVLMVYTVDGLTSTVYHTIFTNTVLLQKILFNHKYIIKCLKNGANRENAVCVTLKILVCVKQVIGAATSKISSIAVPYLF